MAIKLPYPFPNSDDIEWSQYALWYNLKYLADAITRIRTGQLVPAGSIVIVRTGSTCPEGYTKLSTGIEGRYIKLTTGTAGTTGGSLNVTVTDPGHTHTVNPAAFMSSLASSTTIVQAGTNISVATGTHVHSINVPQTTSSSSTTGVTGTINPTFLTFILCEKT